jgi:hypothetical protein
MEFRWVAAIAVWTFLSAPIMGPPASPTSTQTARMTAPAAGGSALSPKTASPAHPNQPQLSVTFETSEGR